MMSVLSILFLLNNYNRWDLRPIDQVGIIQGPVGAEARGAKDSLGPTFL